MPTVPVKAAGWRIEPPVSVAVAPAQRKAATAAAEPPDEPPGTSWALSSVRAGLDAAAARRNHHRPYASSASPLVSTRERRHGLTTGP